MLCPGRFILVESVYLRWNFLYFYSKWTMSIDSFQEWFPKMIDWQVLIYDDIPQTLEGNPWSSVSSHFLRFSIFITKWNMTFFQFTDQNYLRVVWSNGSKSIGFFFGFSSRGRHFRSLIQKISDLDSADILKLKIYCQIVHRCRHFCSFK